MQNGICVVIALICNELWAAKILTRSNLPYISNKCDVGYLSVLSNGLVKKVILDLDLVIS